MVIFTSHWMSVNSSFEIDGPKWFERQLRFFFKDWLAHESMRAVYRILVEFNSNHFHKPIDNNFFKYSRKVSDNMIITRLSNVRVIRALIREVFKSVNPSISVVGISELSMVLIRSSIIEPLQFLLMQHGWQLAHGCGLVSGDKCFLFLGKSKSGKSSLAQYIISKYKWLVLSDNYCFIKSNKVLGFYEPMRVGKAKRFEFSYYGRSVRGWPTVYESDIDKIFYIKRGDKNEIKVIEESIENVVKEIDHSCKEGIRYISIADPIFSQKFVVDKNIPSYYEVSIKNGLKNISMISEKLISKLNEVNI